MTATDYQRRAATANRFRDLAWKLNCEAVRTYNSAVDIPEKKKAARAKRIAIAEKLYAESDKCTELSLDIRNGKRG